MSGNEGRFFGSWSSPQNDGIADWVPDPRLREGRLFAGMTVKVRYLVTFADGGAARDGGAAGAAVGGVLVRKLLRGMS